VIFAEWKGYSKRASPTHLAIDSRRAAMLISKFLHEGKADTAALERTPVGIVDSVEPFE
jgi:hypothetical protein